MTTGTGDTEPQPIFGEAELDRIILLQEAPGTRSAEPEVLSLLTGFLREGRDQAVVSLDDLSLVPRSYAVGDLLLGGDRVQDSLADQARAREPKILRIASACIAEEVLFTKPHDAFAENELPGHFLESFYYAQYRRRAASLINVASKQAALGDVEGALSTMLIPKGILQRDPMLNRYHVGRIIALEKQLGADEQAEDSLALLYANLSAHVASFIEGANKYWNNPSLPFMSWSRGVNGFAEQFKEVYDILLEHGWSERAGWVVDRLVEAAQTLEDCLAKTRILGEEGFVESLSR